MVLFIAYPSVSVKIFRLFRCIPVEGKYWLVADMRLQCFTGRWTAFAAYGAVMVVLYVVGLPALTTALLWKHRRTLFGPGSDATMKRFGFLYDRCGVGGSVPFCTCVVDVRIDHQLLFRDHDRSYGPNAWWWETEELVRKLLLTAVAVLLDARSPLQVRRWHWVNDAP